MRLTILVLLAVSSAAIAADNAIIGYDDDASARQREAEVLFDASIDAVEMDGWLKRMSATPHHAGSAAGKKNAEFIAQLLESWGYEVEIAEYQILLPTPKVREIELLAPTQFKASLREDSLAEDPSTSVREDLLPPYNAFSVDGEVEGELVFANYGRPEDYEILDRYGISVEGKIAIAKYGRSWRGIKPKLAGEKGAIGTILYSDPADDGYGAGDPYPKGAFKHATGIQRGSVMDMPTSFCAKTRPTITRPFGSSSSEYHQAFLGRQRCRPSWVRRSPSRSTRCQAPGDCAPDGSAPCIPSRPCEGDARPRG